MSAASAPVPQALRARLVEVAADVLGAMEPAEVPAQLRAIARFAPRKRAAAGAGPLWLALQHDPFRARVARVWATSPASGQDVAATAGDGSDDDALAADGRPGEITDLDRAVGAWLRRSDEWVDLVPAQEPDPGLADDPRVVRLVADLERVRRERDHARAEAQEAQDALAGNQRELRRLRSDADRARSEARSATARAQEELDAAQAERAEAAVARSGAAEDRREAEAVRAAARAEARVARQLAEVRVRLLLDTIVDAASGLRTELALPPTGAERPADLVTSAGDPVPRRRGSRGRSVDDPALLDDILRLPRAHLVVDGYNVSKTGFGGLALDEQRRRLVDGLAVVAARTGAEVTCCFDGQEGLSPPGGHARGVRVRFSVGEIADDLIRRLVRAEPTGRVVVVVTSDQAVARDVEASGAWVVPAPTLVARLNRV